MLGFLAGAVLYGVTYANVFPAISAIANVGSTTLPTVLDVDLWGSVLFFVLVALTLFYFLERHGQLRRGGLESQAEQPKDEAA